jgi:aminomethyltransferase
VPANESTLRTTPLRDRHLAAKAKLVPFAGWEMPLQYSGIGSEHLAVRQRVGVFDVSHMGQLEVVGARAEALVERLVTARITGLEVGAARYGVVCREDGGCLDDVIVYRLADERFLVVTNAANHERDSDWFERHASEFGCTIRDRRDEFAMLAVQGPAARALVASLLETEGASADPLPLLPPRMRCRTLRVAGVTALACGTGYTGEDGLELLVAPDAAGALWDAVVAAGAQPCGLGARDTLRIEACLPLYGNELSERRTPLAAGLDFCVAFGTGFIGEEALRASAPPAELLVPLLADRRTIPRAGCPVRCREGGEAVGEVTSGTFSPLLRRGIALAYVPRACAVPGTTVDVEIRGRVHTATVARKPLHRTAGGAASSDDDGRAG